MYFYQSQANSKVILVQELGVDLKHDSRDRVYPDEGLQVSGCVIFGHDLPLQELGTVVKAEHVVIILHIILIQQSVQFF